MQLPRAIDDIILDTLNHIIQILHQITVTVIEIFYITIHSIRVAKRIIINTTVIICCFLNLIAMIFYRQFVHITGVKIKVNPIIGKQITHFVISEIFRSEDFTPIRFVLASGYQTIQTVIIETRCIIVVYRIGKTSNIAII